MKTAMDSYLQRQRYLQAKAAAPKPVIVGWRLKVGSLVYYENASIQLCYHFCRVHSLKVSPTPIYK